MVIYPTDSSGTDTPMTRYPRPITKTLAAIFKIGAISFACFVAYESLTPAGSVQSVPHLDKIVHAGVYGVLGFLSAAAWPRVSLVFLCVTATLLGGALEIAQGMMGLGRTASIGDTFANSLGAGLAGLLWVLIIKFMNTRQSAKA